jgi:hypothetical protein
MRKIFSFLFMLLVMVCQVSASEVYIETEGSDRYIALRADSPIAISGYFLQLNFSSKTDIASIEPIPPFNGLANVKKTDGYAKVVAYNTELNSEKQKQMRFASIDYTGADDIEIIVIELYDENNRPVVVTNPQFPVETPPPTPTQQEYSNPPGYISPESPSGTPTQLTQSGSVVEPVQSPTSESAPISTTQQQQPQAHTPVVTSGQTSAETPVSPAGSPIRDEPQSTPKQNLPLSVYLSLTGLIIVTLLFRDRRKCF